MDGAFYQVPKGRRYWVVRAHGGGYLPHFLSAGVAAIGHVDNGLNGIPGEPPDQANWATIYQRLLMSADDPAATRSLKSIVSQAQVFVNEISVGDWILVPGEGSLAIGVVSGNAFWADEPVTIYHVDSPPSVMQYKLRRKVTWGPTVYRADFSSPLQWTLRANQTVFNVDSHWEAICHTIYPAFSRDQVLYLTAKIKSHDKINNVDVASFLSTLSDIEVLARSLDRNLTSDNFENKLNALADANQLSLATKAEFYSPGDIWVQLASGSSDLFAHGKWMAVVVFAYSMLFGNSKIGFDGILDLDTRHKIRDLMLNRIQARRTMAAINNMSVELPNKKTNPLESEDGKLQE
jgi:hypothetical protein